MKKRHHFVPQFYLKNFATPKPKEEIWTYDIQEGHSRGSLVENTAFEKYLYSIPLEKGERLDDLEDAISKIEGDAAPILTELLMDKPPSKEKKEALASFLALMYVRTDSFRHQFAQIMVSGIQLQMHATASHDVAFKNYIADYQKDTGHVMSDEEIQEVRESLLNPQDFSVSVDKAWTLQALSFHQTMTPILRDMKWTIFRARGESYFITSDNPLIFGVSQKHLTPLMGGGLLHDKVELTIPLSFDQCLLATWCEDAVDFDSLEVDSETVKYLNRQRAIFARRFLFGPKLDYGIVKLGKKYKDPPPGMQISGGGPEAYSPVTLRRSKGRKD